MKRTITCLCLFLLILSCKKDTPKKPDEVVLPDIVFQLEAKYNTNKITADVPLSFTDTEAKGATAKVMDNMNFALSFTMKAGSVLKVGDVVQTSGVTLNDFTKPVNYTLTTNGTTKNYKVTIANFSNLPVFYLTTASPVVSKDDYVTGNLTINTNGTPFTQEVKSMDLTIKGRGNSTWDMPKKPYRLKLNTKAKILGLTAAKNWVLLANYADKTLMRNYLADQLALDAKSDFAHHGTFVEVFMNGDYNGTYLLTEQVEINTGRVDIPELKATDNSAAAITGGYLLEFDQRNGEKVNWVSERSMLWNLRSPEEPSPEQLAYIKGYIKELETAMFGPDFADPVKGYAKYVDVDSFISWYLVNEIFKNQDAKNFSSMFYYKSRGGKMGMGPAWDFDLAAGNVDYSEAVKPEGWWVKDGVYISQMYKDPAFAAKVKAKWDALKLKGIPELLANIDKTEAYLDFAQRKNFNRWNILEIYVWPNPVVLGTYQKEVAHVKDWITRRIKWLDDNIK